MANSPPQKKEIPVFQEGNLRNGDHLLQVGSVRLWGMGAQQVITIIIVVLVIMVISIMVIITIAPRWQQSYEVLVKNASDWSLLDPSTLQTYINRSSSSSSSSLSSSSCRGWCLTPLHQRLMIIITVMMILQYETKIINLLEGNQYLTALSMKLKWGDEKILTNNCNYSTIGPHIAWYPGGFQNMGSWKQEGCGGQERMPWDLSSSKFKFVSPLSKLAATLNLQNTVSTCLALSGSRYGVW